MLHRMGPYAYATWQGRARLNYCLGSQTTLKTRQMGVSEIRGTFFGVLFLRGCYYLGVYIKRPIFS